MLPWILGSQGSGAECIDRESLRGIRWLVRVAIVCACFLTEITFCVYITFPVVSISAVSKRTYKTEGPEANDNIPICFYTISWRFYMNN